MYPILSKKSEEIYNNALSEIKNMGGDELALLCGPAHIVWDDYNTDDGFIHFCLSKFDKLKKTMSLEYSDEIMEIVKLSLQQLLEIDEEERYNIA